MSLNIRPVNISDTDSLFELTILAFEPVFTSFRKILGDQIYESIWPDWKASKKKSIGKLCRGEGDNFTFVAEFAGMVTGLVTYEMNSETRNGAIIFLAVHPDTQRRGIGTKLNVFALDKMREAGMILASADTGGDDSHMPARISYEKAGMTALPLVRFFVKLN